MTDFLTGLELDPLRVAGPFVVPGDLLRQVVQRGDLGDAADLAVVVSAQ